MSNQTPAAICKGREGSTERILKRQKARKMLGDPGKIRQEDLRGSLGRWWPRQTKELIGKCSQKPEDESEKEIAVIYGSV